MTTIMRYHGSLMSPKGCATNATDCFQALGKHGTLTSQTNQLSKSQQLLLKWHNQLSHMKFGKMQDLPWQGCWPKSISTYEHPTCCSCQLGKAHHCPVTSPSRAWRIDSGDLQPSDCVSVDQIESPAPGYATHVVENPHWHGIMLHPWILMPAILCSWNSITPLVAQKPWKVISNLSK